MAKVSVVIPTYNRGKRLLRAIASVLYQSYNNLEVIVVDDGSTDNTRELINSFFKNHIIYIKHKQNRGVSAARNTGIRASKAPFIAFLDSDDYWFSEKLQSQMNFFAENPMAVACQSDEIWIRNGRRVNPGKRHIKPNGDIFKASLRLCLVSPSAVMIKKSLFDEIGLFDETLPACEDYDLWLRISCRYPIHLIKKPLLVKEGGHKDQLSTQYRSMDLFRIKSIVRLLRSKRLNVQQITLAMDELAYKCQIYSKGCIKRGRKDEGNFYRTLPKILKKELNLPEGSAL